MVFSSDDRVIGLTCVVGCDMSDFLWTVWIDMVDAWYCFLFYVVCISVIVCGVIIIIKEFSGDFFNIAYFIIIVKGVIIMVHIVIR